MAIQGLHYPEIIAGDGTLRLLSPPDLAHGWLFAYIFHVDLICPVLWVE